MTADASVPSSRLLNHTLKPRQGRIKSLLSGQHGPGEALFEAAAQFSPDYEYFYEDFTAGVITATTGPFAAGTANTLAYAESNAAAVDPAKLAPTAADSSSMSVYTSANAYGQTVAGQKMYTADKFPFFEVRLKVSQVTGFAMAVGFADAIPASAAIMFNIDTPTVTTVADGAFFAIDLSKTLKTAALIAVGTSTAVSKVNVNPVTAPFGVPTAATFVTIRVQLAGNGQQLGPSIASLFVNDALVATNLGGPDSEKLLLPFIYNASTAGVASNMDIDYIRAGQFKAGAPF